MKILIINWKITLWNSRWVEVIIHLGILDSLNVFIKRSFSGEDEEEEKGSDEDNYDDDKQSQVGYASDNQWSDSEEEYPDDRQSKYDNDDAKTRFSQYSMSSSIMRRNNGLSLLDDKFEKVKIFHNFYTLE